MLLAGGVLDRFVADDFGLYSRNHLCNLRDCSMKLVKSLMLYGNGGHKIRRKCLFFVFFSSNMMGRLIWNCFYVFIVFVQDHLLMDCCRRLVAI